MCIGLLGLELFLSRRKAYYRSTCASRCHYVCVSSWTVYISPIYYYLWHSDLFMVAGALLVIHWNYAVQENYFVDYLSLPVW